MALLLPAHDGVISIKAGADLSSTGTYLGQYRGAAINTTAMTCVIAPDDALYAIGILLNSPYTGEEAKIFVGPGICPALAGGTVTIRYPQSVLTGGTLQNAVNADNYIGQAMETAASGEVFNLLINCLGHIDTASTMQS